MRSLAIIICMLAVAIGGGLTLRHFTTDRDTGACRAAGGAYVPVEVEGRALCLRRSAILTPGARP